MVKIIFKMRVERIISFFVIISLISVADFIECKSGERGVLDHAYLNSKRNSKSDIVEVYKASSADMVTLLNETTVVLNNGKTLELPPPQYKSPDVINAIIKNETTVNYKSKTIEYYKENKNELGVHNSEEIQYIKKVSLSSNDNTYKKEILYIKKKNSQQEDLYNKIISYHENDMKYTIRLNPNDEIQYYETNKVYRIMYDIVNLEEAIVYEDKIYYSNGNMVNDNTNIGYINHKECKCYNIIYKYRNRKLYYIDDGETGYFHNVYPTEDAERVLNKKEPIGKYWWHEEIRKKRIQRNCGGY